ncbi:MAG TPA: ATP synthase F1 subunit delta [Acidobacteriaceae bacterium]|nr:ATP synthase F1 subunit delta [Acidobacteriaceae bacterium]
MASVAPRYARAFAEVADASHLDTVVTQQQLRDFAQTLADSGELREILENPSIEMAGKLKVLDALAGRMAMFPQVRNFIAVILEHQRLAELDEILTEYKQVSDEQAGATEARITSARPLNTEDRTQLEAQIAKLAGARVRASYAEDATLLGGAVVEIGSTVYDGSLRAQLQQLKQKLVNA